MPKNRKLQNVIGTEHIKDAAEAEIAAQASGGATVAFKNVAVSGQDTVVADAATDTLNIAGGSNITVTTNASTDTVTIAAAGGSPGGSDGQIQYNNGGSFGGSSLTFTDTDGSEQFLFSDTSDTALVKIEQLGTGNAFEVHDVANDTSIFKVTTAGSVGIGLPAGMGFGGSKLYVTGDTHSTGRFRAEGTMPASSPPFTFNADTNTGIFTPGADSVGISTAGTERLRVGSSGEIGIAGANYGTSGQVLTSGGSGSAVSWTTVSGGGGGLAKAVGAGILSADPFANNSSYQSAYPLWACTTNTNGTGWSGYPSTTEVHLIPFQVPVDGDLAELAFRTSGSSWGPITTYWAIYGAGNDNLPVGAPLFNTSFSISPGNEYEFAVTGVTGKSAGDLLYFAFLGVTDIATITLQIGNMRDGGFGFIFPRRISSSNINHQILRNYTMLKYTGATAGTFPTIGANHAFDNTVSNTFLMNIGARYS